MASAEGRGPRPSVGGFHGEPKELWPRDFGRDGASGMVTLDRAMRARDVSSPTAEDELEAASVVESLLARIDGRRARSSAR
jgi:hypothetical protein